MDEAKRLIEDYIREKLDPRDSDFIQEMERTASGKSVDQKCTYHWALGSHMRIREVCWELRQMFGLEDG